MDELVKAWAAQRETLRAAGEPEEDLPSLSDVLSAGMRAHEFAVAMESLETAQGEPADGLPGLAEGILRLAGVEPATDGKTEPP